MSSEKIKSSEQLIPEFFKSTMEDHDRRLREQKERLKNEGVKKILICDCGKEKETNEIVLPENRIEKRKCSDCLDAEKKQELITRKNILLKQFNEMVPSRYQFIEHEPGDKLKKSDNAILFGGFGTGKTWEAYSLIQSLFVREIVKNWQMVTELSMLNDIKSGLSDNTFDSKVEKYKSTDLLIIDEMGKANGTEFNKAQIFDILNYRYDWEKRTILICNAEEKNELYEILNPAVLDRFRSCLVHFDGKSRRPSDE